MNQAILTLLKRFAPAIREKALPAIKGILDEKVAKIELKEDEEFACAMISQPYSGDWWVFLVTMSEENQVKRIIKSFPLSDLLEETFNNLEAL